jgi:hypothetical protein
VVIKVRQTLIALANVHGDAAVFGLIVGEDLGNSARL